MSGYVELAERIIKALKKYGCFIFESTELEKVRDLAVKSEILKLVEIRPVDEKYPYVFAMVAAKRGIDRECASIVESMISRGEISQNEYKRYKKELLEQCLVSMERERIKEVISTLEDYISRIKGSG
jgi:hypothetical protein